MSKYRNPRRDKSTYEERESQESGSDPLNSEQRELLDAARGGANHGQTDASVASGGEDSALHGRGAYAFRWASGQTEDPFQFRGALGDGGEAEVHRVRNAGRSKDTAVRLLKRTGGEGERERARERFSEEVNLAKEFDHPRVVRPMAMGTFADGTPWLELTLVEGRTLHDAHAQTKQGFDIVRVLDLALDALSALEHVHGKNLVHADGSLKNWLLDDTDRLYLTDFGNAVKVGHTSKGGTRPWRAPESRSGNPLDVRSDLWSLGAVLITLLYPPSARAETGWHQGLLFHERELELKVNWDLCLEQIELRLHKQVQDFLERALAIEREYRFASASEMTEAARTLRRLALPGHDRPDQYLPLEPFQLQHAAWLHGRDELARALRRRIEVGPGGGQVGAEPVYYLTVVTGPQGAGKTSLVLAGALGRISTVPNWSIIEVRDPGRLPLARFLEAARDALGELPMESTQPTAWDNESIDAWLQSAVRCLQGAAHQDEHYVVYVDAFEELVTAEQVARERVKRRRDSEGSKWNAEEKEGIDEVIAHRETFCRLLHRLAEEPSCQWRIVVSLRHEYEAALSELPGLGQHLRRCAVAVRSPSDQDLREALQAPLLALPAAERPSVDSALLNQVVADLRETDAPLTYLALAGKALLKKWDDVRKTSKGTELRLGPSHWNKEALPEVLSGIASETFDTLDESSKESALYLLVEMTTPDGKARASVGRDALVGALRGIRHDVSLDDLLRPLMDSGVVRVTGPDPKDEHARFTIGAEVLLRVWPPLVSALADAAEERLALERLGRAATEWKEGGGLGALWSARQLTIWRHQVTAARKKRLHRPEQSFLAASEKAYRRNLVGRAGVGILVLGLFGVLIWSRFDSAQADRRTVLEREKALAAAGVAELLFAAPALFISEMGRQLSGTVVRAFFVAYADAADKALLLFAQRYPEQVDKIRLLWVQLRSHLVDALRMSGLESPTMREQALDWAWVTMDEILARNLASDRLVELDDKFAVALIQLATDVVYGYENDEEEWRAACAAEFVVLAAGAAGLCDDPDRARDPRGGDCPALSPRCACRDLWTWQDTKEGGPPMHGETLCLRTDWLVPSPDTLLEARTRWRVYTVWNHTMFTHANYGEAVRSLAGFSPQAFRTSTKPDHKDKFQRRLKRFLLGWLELGLAARRKLDFQTHYERGIAPVAGSPAIVETVLNAVADLRSAHELAERAGDTSAHVVYAIRSAFRPLSRAIAEEDLVARWSDAGLGHRWVAAPGELRNAHQRKKQTCEDLKPRFLLLADEDTLRHDVLYVRAMAFASICPDEMRHVVQVDDSSSATAFRRQLQRMGFRTDSLGFEPQGYVGEPGGPRPLHVENPPQDVAIGLRGLSPLGYEADQILWQILIRLESA